MPSSVTVRVPDRLRGPANLATFATSYVVRGPAAAMGGLSAPAALALTPVCAAWAASRAVSGVADAVRIGMRVRRAPVLRPWPGLLAAPDELRPVCTLLSDTHVTAPGRGPCELDVDPGQWPWQTAPDSAALVRGVRRLLTAVRRDAPPTVVWCGDEVDTGDPAEWAQWQAAVVATDGLAHRLVPGNHDICFNRPHDHDYTLGERALRERAYQAHGGRLADFPVVDTIVSDAGVVTVLLLDSCRHRSTHILSNAIGRFGDDQLDEVARQLARARGPVLCIAHHHVWRDARFLQPDEWYNTAVDADRLGALLVAYRRRDPRNQVLVCHGHRHTLTAGVFGDADATIAVVGLPSSTMGDKAATGRLDGVLRYAVAGLRGDGTWAVAMHAVGRLVASAEAVARRPSTLPAASLRALSPVPPAAPPRPPTRRRAARTGS
ncbi:MAG: metallophosphoesterase [Kofleriaceae bacterium]|nr:metallophosphoesterase [Kofleriaceae bacterium]